MSEDTNNIELRSEEVQEILGEVPAWILRRGITLTAIIVVVILLGSAFFKYPDVITSSGLCKLNCVMLYSHLISSVGDRPAPRGCTSTPDERKITTT